MSDPLTNLLLHPIAAQITGMVSLLFKTLLCDNLNGSLRLFSFGFFLVEMKNIRLYFLFCLGRVCPLVAAQDNHRNIGMSAVFPPFVHFYVVLDIVVTAFGFVDIKNVYM